MDNNKDFPHANHQDIATSNQSGRPASSFDFVVIPNFRQEPDLDKLSQVIISIAKRQRES